MPVKAYEADSIKHTVKVNLPVPNAFESIECFIAGCGGHLLNVSTMWDNYLKRLHLKCNNCRAEYSATIDEISNHG